VYTWCTTAQNTPPPPDLGFRRAIQHNAETLVKKAELIACRTQTDTVSTNIYGLNALTQTLLLTERIDSPSTYSKYHRPHHPCQSGTAASSNGDYLPALDVIMLLQRLSLYFCDFPLNSCTHMAHFIMYRSNTYPPSFRLRFDLQFLGTPGVDQEREPHARDREQRRERERREHIRRKA
jgi:hypothetical protein